MCPRRWPEVRPLMDRVLDGLHTEDDARELNEICVRIRAFAILHELRRVARIPGMGWLEEPRRFARKAGGKRTRARHPASFGLPLISSVIGVPLAYALLDGCSGQLVRWRPGGGMAASWQQAGTRRSRSRRRQTWGVEAISMLRGHAAGRLPLGRTAAGALAVARRVCVASGQIEVTYNSGVRAGHRGPGDIRDRSEERRVPFLRHRHRLRPR